MQFSLGCSVMYSENCPAAKVINSYFLPLAHVSNSFCGEHPLWVDVGPSSGFIPFIIYSPIDVGNNLQLCIDGICLDSYYVIRAPI